MSESTLYKIETELTELMQLRDGEDLEPEEIEAIDQQIAEYCKREVAKVDGVRAYLLHAEMQAAGALVEAERLKAYAKAWVSRGNRLKAYCIDVMQASNTKTLEGRTGQLSVRKNGGLQPLVIAQPELIPDECKKAAIIINLSLWKKFAEFPEKYLIEFVNEAVVQVVEIDNTLVRAALTVPGAHLEPRGSQLRYK